MSDHAATRGPGGGPLVPVHLRWHNFIQFPPVPVFTTAATRCSVPRPPTESARLVSSSRCGCLQRQLGVLVEYRARACLVVYIYHALLPVQWATRSRQPRPSGQEGRVRDQRRGQFTDITDGTRNTTVFGETLRSAARRPTSARHAVGRRAGYGQIYNVVAEQTSSRSSSTSGGATTSRPSNPACMSGDSGPNNDVAARVDTAAGCNVALGDGSICSSGRHLLDLLTVLRPMVIQGGEAISNQSLRRPK